MQHLLKNQIGRVCGIGLLVFTLSMPQNLIISSAEDNPVIPNVSTAESEEENAVMADLVKEAEKLGVKVLETDTILDVYEKIDDAKEAIAFKDLKVKAKELGIKIDGLTYTEALAKLQKEVNSTQSNDPKVVSKQKTLMTALLDKSITAADEKAYKASVLNMAKQLDLDITGLSVKDAIKKIRAELGDLDTGSATNSLPLKNILDSVYDLRTKNKTAFMKIVQSGAFDGIFKMKVSELSYEKAAYVLTQTLKDHMGLDIYKGKWEDVKAKLLSNLRAGMKEEAKFFNVDITGLSDADAEAKIDIARQIMMANEMVEMQKYADLYGVNVDGLSKDEGWKKIKAVMFAKEEASRLEFEKTAAFYNVDIKGLSNEEAKNRVNNAAVAYEAAKIGISVTGMSFEEAWKVIKAAQMLIPHENTLEQEAAKWGVDITGLSKDEAKAKVDEARKAYELSHSTNNTPTTPSTTTPTEPTTPSAPK